MMTDRKSEYIPFQGGFMHVSLWGNPHNPPLIMWHGLARTGRDFDIPAEKLAHDYFVICPDTIGRGLSSWAVDAATDYSLKTYAAQALSILEHFEIENLRWLGTSMGGLIGMYLAGEKLRNRISHLVINDIGPEVPKDALQRIIKYVGAPPKFPDVPAFQAWLRQVYAPFGDNEESYWQVMTDSSARRLSNGQITSHYDPEIVRQFTDHEAELPIWQYYNNITAKTLLTRGESSDVLPITVVKKMCQSGPKPQFHTFENCGHAPTFTSKDAISCLGAFFQS